MSKEEEKKWTELICERVIVDNFLELQEDIKLMELRSTIDPKIMNRIKTTPPHMIAKLLKTRKRESYKQPEGKKANPFQKVAI